MIHLLIHKEDMKLTIKNSLMILVVALTFFQCGSPESATEDEHGHQEEAHDEHTEGGENVVELSDVQLANAELQFGAMDTLNISGFVNANGILDLPPQNIAAVSAPMNGFVKQANYLVGDYVEKGTVLATLEHMDYIKLQEEYLNIISNLEYLQAEFERQKQLDSARVTSKRQFQEASAAYNSAMSRKKALEKQLQYMGISPARVASGEISSLIAVRAPINGYITALNVHNGSFAQSEQELYELIDTEHMHLELNVFEQDMRKVEIGQPIRFTVPSTGDESYQGEVFLVGKSFDQENKTIKVHGHIEGEHDHFLRGLYVEARIYTGDQKVMALPEEAVVEEGGKSYIFVRSEEAHGDEHAHEEEVKEATMSQQQEEEEHAHEDEHGHEEEHAHEEGHGTTFRRVQVVTGLKDQGFVQIKEVAELPTSAGIVTQGAYMLLAEMKKGEGGHHH
jgi:cobalt-zinc-cadmium efflux system membrane fusion protein